MNIQSTSNLILASGSRARAEMLDGAGVQFTVLAAQVNEDAIKSSLLDKGRDCRGIADYLAEQKALGASIAHPDATVIGCDQVLEFLGAPISKSPCMAEARALLQRLRGQSHMLHSAVVLTKNGQPLWRLVDTVRLVMRDFSDAFLEDYLAHETAILDCVGCYRLESRGVRLFTAIEGDYHSAMGLPLVALLNQLTLTGVLQR